MHHKRGRPKNRRAGCLLCKPHKMNGFGHTRKMNGPDKTGGGNIKQEICAKEDMKEI